MEDRAVANRQTIEQMRLAFAVQSDMIQAMLRTIASLLLVLCPLAAGQSSEPQRAFLSEVASLSVRRVNGQPIDVTSRLQEDVRVSAEAAQALLSTLREYNAGAQILDRELKLAVFERRMQVTADEKVTIAPETELVAAADRLRDALLARKMQELKERLGERDFQNLTKFIEEGSVKKQFFPLRDEEKPIARN